MAVLRYVTHPQVRVVPEVAVPRWGLNDVGRQRAEWGAQQPWLATVSRLVSSDETKALETAAVFSLATGLAIEVRRDLHENDRSATGFVPPERFEQLADRFFADPEASVEGWETSGAAQRRIVAATEDLWSATDGDPLVVGHGAVGTLLLSHLLGVPISRAEDQVGGHAAPGEATTGPTICAPVGSSTAGTPSMGHHQPEPARASGGRQSGG